MTGTGGGVPRPRPLPPGAGEAGAGAPLADRGRRAAFLDRDGVLCEAVIRDGRAFAPLHLEDFRIVPEAAEQVARLRDAGLLCIVYTNQPELANGQLDPAVLDAMHRRLRAAVPVHDVYVCPHDKSEGCRCHKPAVGMLLDAAERWGIDLARSFAIGDRWRDVGAGIAAGCYSILLERPYSACDRADARVATLEQAVDAVLARLDDAPASSGTLPRVRAGGRPGGRGEGA